MINNQEEQSRIISNGIKPGDLFFTTSSNFIAWAIRQRTWGRFSHVQIIVNAEFGLRNAESERPKIDVISADANGVFCRAVTDRELQKYAILTYPEMTGEERTNVVRFCFSQIGKPYDFLGLASFLFYKQLQSDARWFCSELAYIAYKQAGIRLQRRVKQDFISPRDLYISPLLKPIAGNAEYDWV
jgi:uncharacterized protein YycO